MKIRKLWTAVKNTEILNVEGTTFNLKYGLSAKLIEPFTVNTIRNVKKLSSLRFCNAIFVLKNNIWIQYVNTMHYIMK